MNSLISMLIRYRRPVIGVLAALLFICAAIDVFTYLGVSRIRSWDESRHGVSACEMMDTGNYIVNTYNYRPDYWNVKPVFSFYNNIFGMMLFGKNIFGFRFFSAVCYLVIGALMFFLLWRESGPPAALAGAAAFFFCPTNWAHSFRTGDPDATLMLFCFASFVFLWLSLRKSCLLPFAAFSLGLGIPGEEFPCWCSGPSGGDFRDSPLETLSLARSSAGSHSRHGSCPDLGGSPVFRRWFGVFPEHGEA